MLLSTVTKTSNRPAMASRWLRRDRECSQPTAAGRSYRAEPALRLAPNSLGGNFAGLADGGPPRHLKDGNSVLPRDVGKVVQELVERVAAFDVVEQGLDRHARSREDRLPAEVLGRDCDQGLGQFEIGRASC